MHAAEPSQAGPACPGTDPDTGTNAKGQESASVAKGDFPALGPSDAPVTVTVFSDFECPFCARFATMMRKEVLPSERRVRLVFRQFPLPMHPWAQAAGEASVCAYRQRKDYFWSLHDFFFEHQRELTPGDLRERVLAQARAIPGLDLAKFEVCVSRGETRAAIEREVAYANDNGIRATPTVFVNGKPASAGDARQMLALVRQLANDPKSPVPPPEPPAAAKARPQPREVADVAKGDFPALGPVNAPVALTVFSDFQCPYCAKLAEMIRKEVLPVAGRNMRLVFRFFPLSMHPWASASAQAAGCAYQQKNVYFWSFHDFLFGHQRELTAANLHEQILEHAQGMAGLDQVKFQECLVTEGAKAAIERDVAFGNANGVEATPTVFVNGKETEIVAPEQVLTLIRELSPGAARSRGAAPGTR